MVTSNDHFSVGEKEYEQNSNDEIRLYLHQMAVFPLFTQNQEQEHVKEFDSARRAVIWEVSSSPDIARWIIEKISSLDRKRISEFKQTMRISKTEPISDDNETPIGDIDTVYKRLECNIDTLKNLAKREDTDENREKIARLLMETPMRMHSTKKNEERGLIAEYIRQFAKISPEESMERTEHELFERKDRIANAYQRYIDSKNKIANHNLRLVISIAKRYRNSQSSFADCIEEGNIGLMRAIEEYEYRRGWRFATFATWWIRKNISQSVFEQSHSIVVPKISMRLFQKIEMEFMHKYERIIDHFGDIDRIKAMGYSKTESQIALRAMSARSEQKNPEIQKDQASKDPLIDSHHKDLRQSILHIMRSIPIYYRLVFKLKTGLAFDREEREIIRAIIKKRNGAQPITDREKKILMKYLKESNKIDHHKKNQTIRHLIPISPIGHAPTLKTSDEMYLGSLLVCNNASNKSDRKNIHPVHFFEGISGKSILRKKEKNENDDGYSDKEISTIFDVTSKRIQQIKNVTKTKLENGYRLNKLAKLWIAI